MKNKENIYQDIRNRAESIYERYQSTIEQNRKEGCDSVEPNFIFRYLKA